MLQTSNESHYLLVNAITKTILYINYQHVTIHTCLINKKHLHKNELIKLSSSTYWFIYRMILPKISFSTINRLFLGCNFLKIFYELSQIIGKYSFIYFKDNEIRL